jgi:hypothetical protein
LLPLPYYDVILGID